MHPDDFTSAVNGYKLHLNESVSFHLLAANKIAGSPKPFGKSNLSTLYQVSPVIPRCSHCMIIRCPSQINQHTSMRSSSKLVHTSYILTAELLTRSSRVRTIALQKRSLVLVTCVYSFVTPMLCHSLRTTFWCPLSLFPRLKEREKKRGSWSSQ